MSKKIRSYEDLTDAQWKAALAKAKGLGHKDGANAAEWVIQDSWGGRVSRPGQADQAARAFLKMWDEGDTGTLDYPRPPDLSGEMADTLSPAKLYFILGLGKDFSDTDDMELAQAYEEGSNESFFDTLVMSAKAHLSIMDNPRRARPTPGPWEELIMSPPDGKGWGFHDKVAPAYHSYSIKDPMPEISMKEARANARLISCAPDLLKALEYCYGPDDDTLVEPTPSQWNFIKAVLNRAHGE